MKHMRQIAIVAALIITGIAGYMAVQRYYAAQEKSNVKVQFLNFGTDSDSNYRHHSIYDRGYNEGYERGYEEGQRNCA